MAKENRHQVTLNPKRSDVTIEAKEMRPGEYAIVTDANNRGRIVGRIWTSELNPRTEDVKIFAVDNPSSTWTGTLDMRVRLLAPGDEFLVVVGDK